MNNSAILETLRELNAALSVPVWLFGGVAVDFLMGRWTRPHSDIDLNAWAHDRPVLVSDLRRIGYSTTQTGWLTFWQQVGTGRRLEIVFVERGKDGVGELVIPHGDPFGTPGRHRTLPGYMEMERFATLTDVRFRVCSPEGEWLARAQSPIPGRPPDPKLTHDQRLLETLIAAERWPWLRMQKNQHVEPA